MVLNPVLGLAKTVINRLKRYGSLVMITHTVFSLPFGMIAMLWAANGIPEARVFFWIFVALFGARNGANAFNRIADKSFDKKNPRTASRDIPQGRISVYEAYGVTVVCFLLLAFAAYMLNGLCLAMLPLALLIFVLYSYSKRVTWLCHIILGMACGGAPVGSWMAVTGNISVICILMAAAVTCWVAGFDVIYATQDIEFDRKEGLHSIPARFGLQGARLIAGGLHCGAMLFLASLFFLRDLGLELGFLYLTGVALIGVLLVVEHTWVVPGNVKRMKFVAYSINQIVGIVFFVFSALDMLLRNI